MADNLRESGKTPGGRRTAASGGAPTIRREAKPGNPSYAGYEYQIGVTVWVALDLMLAKQAADEITVEPRSEEDIEAAVREPETALLEVAAKGDPIDLIVQAKTRSGAPWTAAAVADVLLGKADEPTGSRKRRSRPLEMLEADPKRHYVFVTNESSAATLRAHEGEHLFDFPEVTDLPSRAHGKLSPDKRATLAKRVLLLTRITEETLRSRVVRLLEEHGHVAKPKHEACIRDMREEVRARICGQHDGRWTRDGLLEVLVRHGGSIAPRRDMDHYVRPASYDRIKACLDREHAVVIAGPSGTGKTLTADILELELRRGDPPFDVVGEEYGPGHVRQALTRPDPVLFHLRDPWGGNRVTPDADRWSGELPKLIESAGPGRKFLVTSRSDVMESAGHALLKQLEPHVARIALEDYGPARLAKIYDGIASDLTGHARTLSLSYRKDALGALGRPYEIKRFLVALSREDEDAPRKIANLIEDSQIDALACVIARQIAPLGTDGVQSAAILWSMLSARGAVSRQVLARLTRRLRNADSSLRPDVQGLTDFLVAGQNLRQAGSTVSFYHPRVEDGLRFAFMEKRNEAEYLLGQLVDALVAWDGASQDWGKETALGVLQAADRVDGLEIDFSPATHGEIDAYLERAALTVAGGGDLDRALRDLIKFGSADHPPSRLARILIEGSGAVEALFGMVRWRPPRLDADDKASLQADSRTRKIVERFVREVLPCTHRRYPSELVALLEELSPNLGEAYWEALDSVAGPGGPHGNIRTIVAGALSEDLPRWDLAIERFARSEAQADDWMQSFSKEVYEAEEHAVDADLADHIIDEPGERYFNARQGMEQLVKLRRARDGVKWIADHRHAQLLARALAEVLRDARTKPDPEELRLLLDVSEGSARDLAWSAVEMHWDEALSRELETELAQGDLRSASLRQCLIKIAAERRAAGSLADQLVPSAAAGTPARRLELLHDIMATSVKDDAKRQDGMAACCAHALGLAATYPPLEQELAKALIEVMTGTKIGVIAATLSSEAANQAETALPTVSTDVAGPLACLAAAAGVEVSGAVTRLFASDDAKDGMVAIQALWIAGKPDRRAAVTAALDHKRYRVRKHALELLVPGAKDPEERARLVEAAAADRSADVRLAFAHLMEKQTWPEAIEALATLLQDTRNFASRAAPAPCWARFSVARAAARALGEYETLPKKAIDALLGAAKGSSDDPFVACAALSALATKDDDRIPVMLRAALQSEGLRGAPAHRPRSQAAAWAMFDRASAGKLTEAGTVALEMAEQETPMLAGPLLLAVGAMGGAERKSLLVGLQRRGAGDRAAVARLAAIATDCAETIKLDMHEQLLLRLVRGEPFDALGMKDREALEAWSSGLDSQQGFERFAAWIAELLRLPVEEKVGDIQAFDLPDRISVMTMRSLSPDREKVGPDDGT